MKGEQMKALKDWIVPWLYTSREYNVGILDKAMDNPGNARLMLNENPIQPSEGHRGGGGVPATRQLVSGQFFTVENQNW